MTHSYQLYTGIITLAVIVTYFNHRFIKLQATIAVIVASLLLSLGFLICSRLGFTSLEHYAVHLVNHIDFHTLLMDYLLSFLLFAGSLSINLNDLRSCKWEIGILSCASTIISALLIGYASYYLLNALTIEIPLIYCLLFGALISPTDPIAVLALFKELKAPRKLNIMVAGESLFNDGVGIVMFLTIYQIAFMRTDAAYQAIIWLFIQQSLGGILYGLALGLFAYWLMKPIQDAKIDVLITLALTTGGYALAQTLNISGPIAMVVAGIFLGNHGKIFAMPAKPARELHDFWELIDEILNAVLFFLIGLELLLIAFSQHEIIAALLIIPLVISVRFVTVAFPMSLFKLKKSYPPQTINILTWGGLRGGLAIALALALPDNPYRELILTMTYAVVVFAIVIQGVTMKPLLKRSIRDTHQEP